MEEAMRAIKRPKTLTLVLIVAFAVVAAGVGGSTAATLITGKQIRNGTIRSEDLSKTLRRRIGNAYAAKVGPDGSLIASRGVRSATRTGQGDFQVVFAREVLNCAAVATPRATAEAEFHGFVTTYAPSANTVRVVLRKPNGNQDDGAGFNLAVIC
jgi:hypothetical protein